MLDRTLVIAFIPTLLIAAALTVMLLQRRSMQGEAPLAAMTSLPFTRLQAIQHGLFAIWMGIDYMKSRECYVR